MIPILYKPNETDFTTHGLGMLSDATECKVTEQINDAYELSISYPVDGIHYADIENGCIIKALVSDGTEQLFTVYDISADYPNATISAEHISYQTNGIIVRPFSTSTSYDAMAGLKSNSINSNPFTFSATLSAGGSYKVDTPASVKSQLEEILKVFGGELYYDNRSITLMERRGQKRNVTLRYGKNIASIKQDQSIADTYTGVVGYWKGRVGGADQTVTGNVISTGSPIPGERLTVVDVSSEIKTSDDAAASVSQVDAAVQEYITKNTPGLPKVSLDIDIAALWQTEEYKNLASIEKIELGDTVTVVFDKLGISEDTRAVKIEWDVLNERDSSVSFGEVERTYADEASDTQDAISDAQDSADDAQDAADDAKETAEDVRKELNQKYSSINLQIGTVEEEQQNMKTQIVANAQGLTTTVQKGEIISQINQSAESVTINADRINLAGYVTAMNLATGGATTINGDNITTGSIDASKVSVTNLNADNIISGSIDADRIGKTINGTRYPCVTTYSYIDDSGSGLRWLIRNLANEEIDDACKETGSKLRSTIRDIAQEEIAKAKK